jgi:hypothetical protein
VAFLNRSSATLALALILDGFSRLVEVFDRCQMAATPEGNPKIAIGDQNDLC